MQTTNPYSQEISHGMKMLVNIKKKTNQTQNLKVHHRFQGPLLLLNMWKSGKKANCFFLFFFLNGPYWRYMFRKPHVIVSKQKICIAYSYVYSLLSENLLYKELAKQWCRRTDYTVGWLFWTFGCKQITTA